MLVSGNIVVQTVLVGLSQFLKVGFLTLVPVGVLHLLGPRAGLDYGRYRRTGSAGFFVAGAAGLLIQATSTSASVWIFAAACLLAALPFLGKVEIPLVRAPEEGWGNLLRDRRTFYFLLGSMLLSTWNAGVWIYLPLRMREMSASPNLISWTMAECGLIAIVSLTWTGRLVDRLKNPALLLLVVPIAAAVRLSLMALPVENPAWFLLIQWMHVPVWVLGEVASIQFVRHYTKVSLFPRVQAVLQVGTYLGMGGASVLMGLVVRDMGIRDTILLSALLPLTALPVLWLSFRAKQSESAN
jgi:predicted MFS family arabinose efflux permease